MRTIMCKSCTSINVERLAKNIPGEVKIVEECSHSNANVVGCAALTRDSRVVDLKLIEKVFENPENVALSWIRTELITPDPEYDVIETGYSVVYMGDNLDIVNTLSSFAELTVVTESNDLIKSLYPFKIKVYKGIVKSVSGKIGDLEVVIEGEDLTRETSGVFKVTCGQAIVPEGLTHLNSGVVTYGEEFKAVLRVIENLGSIKVLKSVKTNPDICVVEKNGILGCTLCLSCPMSSVHKFGNVIELDHMSCTACGYCSSVCPTGAIESTTLPSDVLIEKIDITGGGVVVIICEKNLGELYEIRQKGIKIPEIHPLIVPCLNYVSETHYLYAVLRGSYVIAVPCKCKYPMYNDHLRIANKILSAFGFPLIRVAKFIELKKVVRELKKEKHPKRVIEKMNFTGRRLMAYMLQRLTNSSIIEEEGKIETERYAEISISENCTFCKTCQTFCPTGAIRRDNATARLYFNHILCIACGLCGKACPENAIVLERGLNLRDISPRILFEAEMVVCPSCGKKHISKRAHEKISEILGLEISTMYCDECRPKMIFETIYREVEGE